MIDKQAMTPDNLGAQLGGVLSLWLGITIMTIVEIIEFIYTAIQQCRNARKTTIKSDDLPTQEPDAVVVD